MYKPLPGMPELRSILDEIIANPPHSRVNGS
jgi:hypothetical protein